MEEGNGALMEWADGEILPSVDWVGDEGDPTDDVVQEIVTPLIHSQKPPPNGSTGSAQTPTSARGKSRPPKTAIPQQDPPDPPRQGNFTRPPANEEPDYPSNIADIVLLHCPDSKNCRILISKIKKMRPPLNIRFCNVSGKTARKILFSNDIIKIEGVPYLMIVKMDGRADMFKGTTKILEWISNRMQEMEDEDPMVSVPSKRGRPDGTPAENETLQHTPGSMSYLGQMPSPGGLQFAFANQKGVISQRGNPVKNPAAQKFSETKSLADKMQAEFRTTHGYSEDGQQRGQ
jgi:hypothetical protein